MTLRADWLPSLTAFESAARHQNFAHAAEELHLTASAVSHHVRKLESRLGVALFQRHARGVALTADGRKLADAAGSALADVDGVLRSLHSGREDNNRIRFTTLHSLTYTWLTPRLAQFTQAHPNLRLSIDTEVALTRFDDPSPDFGIRFGPGHWPGLTTHFLMDEGLLPVVSPAFPGLGQIRQPSDVTMQPLISDHSRQGWHDWFRGVGVHGAKFDERLTFTDSTGAMNAAAFGMGIALARSRIADAYLETGRLQRLPVPTVKARWAYYVVYPSHRRLRAAAQMFIDWLLALPKD